MENPNLRSTIPQRPGGSRRTYIRSAGRPAHGSQHGDAEISTRDTQRLATTAIVFGWVYVVAIGIGAIATLMGELHPFNFLRMIVLGLLWIPTSVVVWKLAANGPLGTPKLIVVGCLYELILCIVISASEWWGPGTELSFRGISWNCVLVVLFPVLIPAGPRKIVAWSCICAATGPAAALIAYLLGVQLPPLGSIVMFYVNSYVSVIIALGVARAMQGKRAELSQLRRLGAYELLECIGEGGMGQVWKARHRLLARPAAVKLIRSEAATALGKNAANVLPDRFEKEAKVTARLRSPHTVELYDYGFAQDGTLYFAMEFLDGLDLDRLVRRHGPIPPERVVHLLIQACWSLDEAHGIGLIHRDIKPANLFLARAGTMTDHLKVLDFGLTDLDPCWSSSELADLPVELSAVGKVQGTPAYMAPEIALGQQADGRVDLYCLGLVAFWLLTGEMLFKGQETVELMVAHAYEEPRTASSVSKFEVPLALDELISSLLQKDPDARPMSAQELRGRLEAIALREPWTEARANAWWSGFKKDSPNIPSNQGTIQEIAPTLLSAE